MPEKSVKRSINFSPETLKALDTLAAKNSTTTSELVRQYVEKGLSIF
jgi:predicted DNA-binding protein